MKLEELKQDEGMLDKTIPEDFTEQGAINEFKNINSLNDDTTLSSKTLLSNADSTRLLDKDNKNLNQYNNNNQNNNNQDQNPNSNISMNEKRGKLN